MTDPVSTLVHDIAGGAGIGDSVYADTVQFDATVPGWRFHREGAQAVRQELNGWYAAPGSYDELRRTPLPDGELVMFTLSWLEEGVHHSSHQAHVLGIEDDRVVRHDVWCGGRWAADLLAEMANA
jgi:hypothetical protein